MVNRKRKSATQLWIMVALCAVLLVAVAMILLWKPGKDITSFQECKDAGGAIMESYPEQCAINGKSFTNDAQSLNTDTSAYIGLSEKAALDKAAAANKAARVVERDDEFLPVDASFQPGRLNFHVKDGKVVSVNVEGEE